MHSQPPYNIHEVQDMRPLSVAEPSEVLDSAVCDFLARCNRGCIHQGGPTGSQSPQGHTPDIKHRLGATFSWEIHKSLSAQKPAHARCMLTLPPQHFPTSALRRSCTVQEDLADQDRPQTLHAPRPDSACTANNPSGHHRRASSDTRSKILGMPDCRGA